MLLTGNVPGPSGYQMSANSGDVGGVGGDYAAVAVTCTASVPQGRPQGFGCGSTGSNTTPGVWTSSATQAPEIDPASAASGLTLLLGGLAVLRGPRRKTLNHLVASHDSCAGIIG